MQIERLGGFLSYARLRACRNRQEKEKLLWDLWDAAASLHGVDGGTAQVIERLADEMGRQARVIEAEPNRWISHELDQNAEEVA